MDFEVHFDIGKRYDEPVKKANFKLMVIPDSNINQRVLDLKFSSSIDQSMYISKNIFGFKTIHYHIDKPFTEFWFKLFARVRNKEIKPFNFSPLPPADEYELLNSHDFFLKHYLFLSLGQHRLTEFAYDNTVFHNYSKELQVFDFLVKLNLYIYQLHICSAEKSEMPNDEQNLIISDKVKREDCAKQFISICHKNKIPARYVSGYLNYNALRIVTNERLHVWVEALVPGFSWIGFDPVNNLLVDHHYIKIAHDNNFDDCSPVNVVIGSTKINDIYSLTDSDQ